MNTLISRIALGLGLAALVVGCAAAADDSDPGTEAPAVETENTGTAAQADTLGAPPSCSPQQVGNYHYWLIGCRNGVGTQELFRCEPAGAGKYRWYGQPQVGYRKTTCGN